MLVISKKGFTDVTCEAFFIMVESTTRKPYQFTKVEDLTGYIGRKFNKLTVISYYGKWKDGSHAFNCLCECGKETVTIKSCLDFGRKKSCGCINRSFLADKNRTHGKTGTIEYTTWLSIKARCNNPSQENYPYYGGQEIKMSKSWDESFENFLRDMGPKPSKHHSIERDKVNENYCKENCRWATLMEQAYNKRDTIWVTYNNKKWTSKEFCEYFSIKQRSFYSVFMRLGLEGVVCHYISKGVIPETDGKNGTVELSKKWIAEFKAKMGNTIEYNGVEYTPRQFATICEMKERSIESLIKSKGSLGAIAHLVKRGKLIA